MDNDKIKKLEAAGVETSSALERFMNNDALFEKYLKKFTTNPTYAQLKDALEKKDCKACFEATHALKGNTGTLSLMPLYKLFCEQTDYFRAGDFDKGAAMAVAVDAEYKKMVTAINDTFGE